MRLPLLKLAWRSLWRNKRRTAITLGSIAFGLTIAVFFVSLGAGVYRKAIADGSRAIAGHLTLEHPEYRDAPSPELVVGGVTALQRAAQAVPGVVRTRLMVLGQAVVSTGSGSWNVGFVGLDPADTANRSLLAEKIVEGRYLLPGDGRGAVIGAGLAGRLKLAPGKKLVLTTTSATGELSSELLRVTGIFKTGSDDIDSFALELPLVAARRVLGLGPDQATQVGVVLDSPDDLVEVQRALGAVFRDAPVAIRPWSDLLPELAGWMQTDQRSGLVQQTILLFLIAFTILNTVLMSVVERQREFAVLLALGTPPAGLRLQILAEVALLGVIGVTLGLSIGGGLGRWAEVSGFNLGFLIGNAQSVGGVELDLNVHNRVTLLQLVVLGGLVFLGTMATSLYPMFRATRFDLVTQLRSR